MGAPWVGLRPTVESDLDFVLDLEGDAANRPFVGSWSRDQHRAAIEAADRQHWIVELLPERRRVGYVIGLDLRAVELGAHLKRIVIADKSRGIGRAAVSLFSKQAFAVYQPEFVWLDVLRHNERAQAAYRAAGYRVQELADAERAKWAAAVGGIDSESVVMVCSTPPPSGGRSSPFDRVTGRWVLVATVAVYALIGAAFFQKGEPPAVGFDLELLPLANAILNTLTTVFLASAFVAIRRKRVAVHRRFIYAAFATTGLFLVTYLTYHFLSESTRFGGGGAMAGVYYFLLLTHVVLAMVIVPLALVTFLRGITNRVARHRAIARWTMPIWLYVSVSGVLVYLLIAPYYR